MHLIHDQYLHFTSVATFLVSSYIFTFLNTTDKIAMTGFRVLPLVVVVLSIEYFVMTNTQSSTDCVDGDVRLIGGNHYREGRVEVCRNQQWGRVCDDMWDEKESTVVCKQLGLSDEGAIAFAGNEGSFSITNPTLPYVLDDLGCNGTESNLLECLPQHNCESSSDESAGVGCLRKGVTLENGPSQLSNNSLISTTEIGEEIETLLCATDRTGCCTTESDTSGNWYMPDGSKILQQSSNNSQAIYISRGNQTVGLKYRNGTGTSVPTGIYHCEISDKNNVISYLYVGIYNQNQGNVIIASINYESKTCTIVCTSTGGPATTVLWSKDNNSIQDNDQYYEHSTIIVNRTSATYENRLTLFNKSSNAAGTYTCTVRNSKGSSQSEFHLEVCSDMELRFNSHRRNVEVCINDKWHAVVNSAVVSNITLGNIISTTDSTSVTITWTPPGDLNVSTYDIICTTINDRQMHSVKVTNVNVSIIIINGLLPGKIYECCITVYILRAIPIDTASLSCITTTTLSSSDISMDASNICSSTYIIGLGITLSICFLLLSTCVCMCLLLIRQRKISVKNLRVSIDRDNIEHMVVNPIYSSDPTKESVELNSRKLNIAENPQYGTTTEVTYEMINDLPTKPRAAAGHTFDAPVQAKAESKINHDEVKQRYTSSLESETSKGNGKDGRLSTEQISQQKTVTSIYDLPLDP